MNTYAIYLHDKEIALVEGTEFAYEVYAKTKELADLLNVECCIVWYDTGEQVAYYNPEDENEEFLSMYSLAIYDPTI